MNVGFIGLGEAGFELSRGLNREGLQGIIAYDSLLNNLSEKKKLKERAKEAKVRLLNQPKDILNEANIIFVAVPAKYAIDVCNDIKGYINKNTIYIDVSASTPDVKQEIDRIVKKYKGKFVDAALLGPLTVHQHKVPIMASGNGAQDFINQLSSYGMNIEFVSDKAGDASSIKLLRSIYMKGTAALLVELLDASRCLNLEEPVISSIKNTMEEIPFEKMINQLITGTSIHATRRAQELEGSLSMLTNSGINTEMTSAAKNKLESISQLNIQEEWGGARPKDWQTVIDKIQRISRGD